MRGRLLAIEGLDGSGKSTLARRLADELGAPLFTTPGPAFRALREQIEAALRHEPVALELAYAASVVAECRPIEEAMAQGDVVVDRWWASTVTYAGQRGRSAALDAVEPFVLEVDVTVLVDAPDEVRRRRIAARGGSAHDGITTQAIPAMTLRNRYIEELRRPRHGRLIMVDSAELDAEALADVVLGKLSQPAAQLRLPRPGGPT